MAYKLKHPSTYIEDLSPRETPKLIKTLRQPGSNAIPARWITFVVSIAIILGVLGGIYGIR